MITYVNHKDAKLFTLAAEALGADRDSFDVNQYLNRLGELKAISPRFVRLPVYEEDGHKDEEIFVIDANARTIKVPASFSKNGVGVVSDELAEVLWFEIDRYFDVQDFGLAYNHDMSENLKDGDLHILIQWEAPDGAKGASWAYAVDITTPDANGEYSKVYFGWALTAEHLTAKAGNIKFAVRIIRYDADGIAYSFATQAAQIAIKPSLSFDVTKEADLEIEHVADKIASRIMQGRIANCPVFEENLPAYVLELGNDGAELSVVTKVPDVKDPVTNEMVPGDPYDAIAYKWYKQGQGDSEFVLIDPEDDAYSGQFTPALTVKAAGEYYVVAMGMKEIIDSEEYIYANNEVSEDQVKFKYHSSIASSQSVTCKIPAPMKLQIIEAMPKAFIIDGNPEKRLSFKITRQSITDPETQVASQVGNVVLDIRKTASAALTVLDNIDNAEFAPVDEPEGTEAQPEQWYYNGEPYDTEAEAKDAADQDQGAEAGEGDYTGITKTDAVPATITGPGVIYRVEDNVAKMDMTNAEEGYYKITLSNNLNGIYEETDVVNTDYEDLPYPDEDDKNQVAPTKAQLICRVVKPAAFVANSAVATPKLADGSDITVGHTVNISDHDKLVATVSVAGLSDELRIEWYEQKGDQDPADTTADVKVAEGEFMAAREYTPTTAGNFYFVAINKVENTTASIKSNSELFGG